MTTDGSPPESRSFAELFARLDEAGDSEAAFIQLILESAASRDPELPDLLRAAAIPRRLDATIVGVLRERPSDVLGNQRLLGMISAYRFVLLRSDGGFVYHDNTRDALLADWRSTDEKRAGFVKLTQALGSFHEAQYAESLRLDRWLDEVSALIAQANPDRLRRLRGAVEDRMTDSLLEALYHHLLASPQEGVDFFRNSFFTLEQANRLAIGDSLISLARDFVQRLRPDESEPLLLDWLDYFKARAMGGVSPYDETLLRLANSTEVPSDLRTWALNDLARVYEDASKMDSALNTRLKLVDEETLDVYNAPVYNTNLGSLYWWLGDLPSAVSQFKLAIQKVDELPEARQDFGVFARLHLSAVYSELGDWDAAFEAAIEALYRARTAHRDDRGMQQDVAARFAQLLATFDVQASDCAAAEALLSTDTSSNQRFEALLGRLDMLVRSGRIRTARAWTERLSPHLVNSDRSLTQVDTSLRDAMVCQSEGREADAITAYTMVIEEKEGRPGLLERQLVAREGRGVCKAIIAEKSGAETDLTFAREGWKRCGCPILAAETAVSLGDALRRAGDLNSAQNLLNEADAGLPSGVHRDRLRLLTSRGDLAERFGDWPAAQEHYEQALQMAIVRRGLVSQATLLHKLAVVHAERAQWSLSAKYDRRASVVCQELAAADSYNTTGHETDAESENARGVSSFWVTDDRVIALDRARQLFRSATELDPNNFWPVLNLSFTYAEQQDWREAVEALSRSLDLCPPPMHTTRLYGCLRDYTLECARRQRDDPSGAADVVSGALDRLDGKLPTTDVARVRAAHCALLALAGQGVAARKAARAAVALFGGERSLIEEIGLVVKTLDDYWTIDRMLRQVQDEIIEPAAPRNVAVAVRTGLVFRLDQILGLIPDAAALEIPIVTPIVGEVGDELVPIVDSRQDGGVFLYQLIPAMRQRILASTGVNVPGVRMRGNPALGPGGYSILVDEVPVLSGSVGVGASFAVLPMGDSSREPGEELSNTHPRSGDRGLWVLRPFIGERPPGADLLTTAEYLVYRIELVLRAQLVRFLGPQEVAGMIDKWSEQEESNLVASILPDADARLRLTWVLQLLVDEGVPITDWRSLLTAVREAGGITAPLRALHRAARAALRDQLSELQIGRRAISVPAEHEARLLGLAQNDPVGTLRALPQHEFQQWLRETVATSGPGITLVTGSQDARELVSVVARGENRLITTLSEDELRRT